MLVELTAAGETIADLARAVHGEMAVVARAGLGTLNHTLLTLEALSARGIPVAGVLIGAWPQEPSAVELSNERYLQAACRTAGIRWWGALSAGSAGLDQSAFRARNTSGLRDWASFLVDSSGAFAPS